MKFSFRTWGARQLLVAWGIYWTILGVATLRPAASLLAHLARSGAHTSGKVSFSSSMLTVSISSPGASGWSGAIQFSSLVLLLFGPPLLLWVVWAVSRPRRDMVVDSNASPLLREAPYAPATSLSAETSKEPTRRDTLSS